MGHRVLHAEDAFWRPSNQMGVLNTDLAKQLGAEDFGARLWRLAPGQASTQHRHRAQRELVTGAPGEPANTLEMDADTIAHLYPNGMKALPPELRPSG